MFSDSKVFDYINKVIKSINSICVWKVKKKMKSKIFFWIFVKIYKDIYWF